MEKSLANGLAARAVIFGFVALLIWWVLPSSGNSEFKKMSAAMQNARSWRAHTVVNEPTKVVDLMQALKASVEQTKKQAPKKAASGSRQRAQRQKKAAAG